mmetsp:Transcript_23207/g.44296  ORF Transcript_23207/g.44296 Transcript_23207/m.44296 type:complete len:80 (+) Transcript_23207:1130-1369(+)
MQVVEKKNTNASGNKPNFDTDDHLCITQIAAASLKRCDATVPLSLTEGNVQYKKKSSKTCLVEIFWLCRRMSATQTMKA